MALSHASFPGRTVVYADALGKVLSRLQSLVDAIGQAVIDQPVARGMVPLSIKEKTRLVAVQSFTESFGIRLETENGNLSLDQKITDVFKGLIDLVDAGDNETRIVSTLSVFGPRTAAHYKAFAKTLISARANMSINLGVPHDKLVREAHISQGSLSKLVNILEKMSEKLGGTLDVTGQLVGYELEKPHRTFHLKIEDKNLRGKLSDEAASKLVGEEIGGHFNAKILVNIEVMQASGEEKEILTLLDVTPIR